MRSKYFQTTSLLLLLIASPSCVKEVEQESLHEVVFHAGWDAETKTVLQEDGKVFWSPGDEISLFVGDGTNGGYKLTSTNTEPVAKTDFIGQVGENTNNAPYIAIYPYNQANSFNWNTVTINTEIPSVQTAFEESFDNNLFVCAAVSYDENLHFKSICSGIQFSVETPGIKKIVFSTKDGSFISGSISNFPFEAPEAFNYGSSSSLTINAPDESGFVPDKYYYAILSPNQNNSGFDISYYTEDKVAHLSIDGYVLFKKGVFKRLYNRDSGLTFYNNYDKKARLPENILPEGVNRESITEVHFYVNDGTTTSTVICDSDSNDYETVYFQQDGSVVNFYTKGEVYEISSGWNLFKDWSSVTNLDLSMFDTQHVTNMYGMFNGCTSLKSINLSSFNTSAVETMELMFHNCTSLSSLDLSNFDTSNVTYMGDMFSCYGEESGYILPSALKTLDLSSFNTSRVTSMVEMFAGCSSLESINLSGWDTSNVEILGSMFQNCSSLKTIDLSGFETNNLQAMGYMFYGCRSLVELDLSNFNTQNVFNFQAIFNNCTSLEKLDIKNFTTESMEALDAMLENCVMLKQLDMSSFDIGESYLTSSLAIKSKHCAVKCKDSVRKIIEKSDGFVPSYFIWVGLNDTFPEIPNDKDPNLYYSSDYSMHKHVEPILQATKGRGINISIMGDQYSDRLIADGTYKRDMLNAIDAIFELEPYKSFKDHFNVSIVYLVSENEICFSEGGSTALDVNRGLSNLITTNQYALSAFPQSNSKETAVVVICHDEHSFDGSGALGLTFTAYTLSQACANDYGQADQAISWIPAYNDISLFKRTVSHEFGHCFAKLQDEYVEWTGQISEGEANSKKEDMALTGQGKNIDFTNDLSAIKWKAFISDPRYANSGIGAYEGAYWECGAWRPDENSIMRYGTEFNAPSREAIYYRIHKLAYGKDWSYDFESFVQQDLKNVHPVAAISFSSPSALLKKSIDTRKHFYEREEKTLPDGTKKIIFIME